MTGIDEIMGALETCAKRPDRLNFAALELMIASALADARREGAEQMRAGFVARMRDQRPVAWVRYQSDGGIQGPLLDAQVDGARRECWTPLIAAEWVNRDASPAPAAAPVRAEPAMYIGACITDGTLYASVMSRDAAGNVKCVAQAEMDAASLVKQGCLARLSPPPDDEPAQAQPCRCGPDGCSDSVACPKGGAA